MPDRTVTAPQAPEPPALPRTRAAATQRSRRRLYGGFIAAAILVGVSVLFVVLTRMKPAYDAYGWMVWGRQTLHWDLDTNGAPSWKPLTFMFTLPYALVMSAQTWLWSVTSVIGALAGALFGGRIAYRLTGPAPNRPYAPIIAAIFAGVGVLGIADYWHQILIANSDPMVVAICLAAIDFHLCKRYRLAFAMVLLASFGRPEAWPFALGYAIWAWWRVPGMRVLAVAGVVSIPLIWFGVSALTAKSWLRPGDLALDSVNVLHGNKFIGVTRRLLGLYEPPMQIAAGLAIAFAVVIRDKVWLTLAGLAFVWLAIEIAFALHGWSAVTRYLFEPEAVLVVLAGAGLGRVLAAGSPTSVAARARRRRGRRDPDRLADPDRGGTNARRPQRDRQAPPGGGPDRPPRNRDQATRWPSANPRLRPARHHRRLAEHLGLGGRAERRQRRLQARALDRQGQSDRALQTAHGRLAGAPDPHAAGQPRGMQQPADRHRVRLGLAGRRQRAVSIAALPAGSDTT